MGWEWHKNLSPLRTPTVAEAVAPLVSVDNHADMVQEVLPTIVPEAEIPQPESKAGRPEESTEMSIVTTIEKDVNLTKTWITSAASKAEAVFEKAGSLEPEVTKDLATLVTAAEEFLASTTPVVSGEGLNFPADSVAFAKFTALVTAFQATATTLLTVAKSL